MYIKVMRQKSFYLWAMASTSALEIWMMSFLFSFKSYDKQRHRIVLKFLHISLLFNAKYD